MVLVERVQSCSDIADEFLHTRIDLGRIGFWVESVNNLAEVPLEVLKVPVLWVSDFGQQVSQRIRHTWCEHRLVVLVACSGLISGLPAAWPHENDSRLSHDEQQHQNRHGNKLHFRNFLDFRLYRKCMPQN
jgi:hypothetical protein